MHAYSIVFDDQDPLYEDEKAIKQMHVMYDIVCIHRLSCLIPIHLLMAAIVAIQ